MASSKSDSSSSSSGSHGHGSSSQGSCVTPAGAPPPAAGHAAHLSPQPSLNPAESFVAKPEPEEEDDAALLLAATEEPVRVGDKRKGRRLLGGTGAREAARIRRAAAAQEERLAAEARAPQQDAGGEVVGDVVPRKKKQPYRAQRMRARSPGVPSSDEETVDPTPEEGKVGGDDLPRYESQRINPSSGSPFRGRSALKAVKQQRRRRGS